MNANEDLMDRSHDNPFFRSDLGSVLVYSSDIPVLDTVHYLMFVLPRFDNQFPKLDATQLQMTSYGLSEFGCISSEDQMHTISFSSQDT